MFKPNKKTLERRQWRRSGVFIVKLWAYFTPFSSVSIVNFEQEKDHRLLNSLICERKWIEAHKEA